jgi:mannose-1-phosphate guanylyltransferase
MTSPRSPNPCWVVVVADDHNADWASGTRIAARRAPVQYTRLGESATLLQTALRRAQRIATVSRVVVTALEENREYWEPPTWFIPPVNKFVGVNRAASLLMTTAALLAIAAKHPSSVVTILRARCLVERESILSAALVQAVALLPLVDEGVITLGMLDIHDGVDEDYLVGCRAKAGPGFAIQGYARRPIPWIARHLKQQGAMVASDILVGYAGAFAAHISKQWPGLTRQLTNIVVAAAAANVECEVPMDFERGMPSSVLRLLRWTAPTFAQRAFRVHRCGWSGLKSPQAVERLCAFISDAADRHGERMYEEV